MRPSACWSAVLLLRAPLRLPRSPRRQRQPPPRPPILTRRPWTDLSQRSVGSNVLPRTSARLRLRGAERRSRLKVGRKLPSGPPRIDNVHTAVDEVVHVSGGDAGPIAARNGSDLGIEVGNWPAGAASIGSDLRVRQRIVRRESEHVTRKVLLEETKCRRLQRSPSLPFGKQENAMQNLGLRDGRGVKVRARARFEPSHHRWLRRRPHQFGQHVGVQNDHGSGSGGSRIGCRSGSSSTRPPSGAKRSRAKSARERGACSGRSRASRSRLRASSSIER